MNYNPNLHSAVDKLARRCSAIGSRPIDPLHSAWLYDQVMRTFEDTRTEAVTLACTINLVGKGEATVHRDGTLEMRSIG